jgi:acyl dehydratase
MTEPLRIRAVNTAADSENKIHDDRIAAQYGFRGGLVPGVTVYGYLAAAVIDHFGDIWLNTGAIDVRFLQPVYEGDEAIVTLAADPRESSAPDSPGRVRVNVCVNGAECASAVAWLPKTDETHDQPAPAPVQRSPLPSDPTQVPDRRTPTGETLAPGTVLVPISQPLDLAQSRISAPLDPAVVVPPNGALENRSSNNSPGRFAHPAVLLALANEIFVKNYELGPWIHSSSQVRKFSAAQDGEFIYTSAKVEDRFERKGHEFVVLDVVIAALGAAGIGIASGDVTPAQDDLRIVERIRHTAIWRPRVSV